MEILIAISLACGIWALIVALNACVRLNKIELELMKEQESKDNNKEE